MPNITLICTQHGENGACNSNELCRIVERIQPDVIFEELPPYAFDDYYVSRTKSNLETIAISAYIENHQAKHIPVDLNFDPLSLIKEYSKVHKRVEPICHDYQRLIDSNYQYVARYGFRYLNSDYCSNLQSDINDAIKNTLIELNDDKLFQIDNQWNDIIEKRENEMLGNIYQYSRDDVFERGLFFIGSAHRKSIIEKIQKQVESEVIEMNWNVAPLFISEKRLP